MGLAGRIRSGATSTTLLAVLAGTIAWHGAAAADEQDTIAYPDGYREWAHVKSTLMSPQHAGFGENGGFHHIYANKQALGGYRTRTFPEGSVIVFDWLQMRDAAGVFEEGPRRRIDVMVKDSARFATTGGWGFERFVGDSRTERAATPSRDACFSCHKKLARDGLVLSTLRQ